MRVIIKNTIMLLTGNIFADLGGAFLRLMIGSVDANSCSEDSSWFNCNRRLSRRVNLLLLLLSESTPSLFVCVVTFTADWEENSLGT